MNPEDLPHDLTAAEVAALGALAAPDAELPLAAAGPRVPEFGSRISCGGKEAQVLVVHRPGDPDSPVDLVVKHGSVPEVLLRQPHAPASGWCWLEELPPPPPTLEDKLRALAASGVRVPRVGDTVLCIRAEAVFLTTDVPYSAQRARVLAVKEVLGRRVSVNLACFVNPDPPEDTRDPDPIAEDLQNNNCVGPLGPGDRGEGWSWPGWESPPALTEDERIPKQPCTRCGTPYPHSRRIEIRANAYFGRWRYALERPSGAVAQLCPSCAEAVLTFATTSPPEPAVVLAAAAARDRAEPA